MKTLGILGGIAPESTIAYYRSIIAEYREQVADGSYPQIIIDSIDLTRMLGFAYAGKLEELSDYLLVEITRLHAAGAQIGLMASNTPHLVFDAVAAQAPIPLISIVECARDAARERGFQRVGLLGTQFTMQADFYSRVFATAGIRVVSPSAAEQEFVHQRYMGELVNAKFLPATRTRLTEIIQELRKREHIEAVILGGTELPLLFQAPEAAGLPLLDTTAIHVRRAVAEMIAQSASV